MDKDQKYLLDKQADLQSVPLFVGLEKVEMEAVCRAAKLCRKELDEYFFFQGDPASQIYVLLEGRVKISQTNADGQQVLFRAIRPTTLFGGLAITKTEVYPVTAQVAEDSMAACWSKEDFLRLVTRYPKLALNAMEMMAARVQEFQDRFRELATERVERRLARTLLRLANQSGRKTEQGVLIDLPLTRQDLAEMTGTTLYTVSRILSQWETQKLIVSGRSRVVIAAPHGLVQIAEDLPTPPEDRSSPEE
ncbi:MAG: Crp/Fnr family transcriptional regulator [Anaerolineaceae bacterium]|nr:Crp/Fnr family transcriptional regulator [Anaerolineaceae bacterium]